VWILGTGGGLFTPPIPTGAMAPFAPLSKLALTPGRNGPLDETGEAVREGGLECSGSDRKIGGFGGA
jgi:hypothetical protein